MALLVRRDGRNFGYGFEQITQHFVPINGGNCCHQDRLLHREVRTKISHELGRGWINVVVITSEDRHE